MSVSVCCQTVFVQINQKSSCSLWQRIEVTFCDERPGEADHLDSVRSVVFGDVNSDLALLIMTIKSICFKANRN